MYGLTVSICYHQILIIYLFDEMEMKKNNSIDNRSLVFAVSSFCFVLLSFALFMFFWIRPFVQQEGMALAGQYGDSFGALNCIFSGLGFSVIITTLIFQQGQIRRQIDKENSEVEERRSLFNLKAWEDANIKAKALLQDGNNDRATWIQAARVVGHAKVLAKGVSIENHQRVMELKSLEYRSFFRQLLQDKTGSFFYGTPHEYSSIDEAAAASSIATEKNERYIFDSKVLSEKSIFAIVGAAEWPENYTDPIDEGFPKEFESTVFLYDGLREFLNHTRMWHSFNGELKRRKGSELS